MSHNVMQIAQYLKKVENVVQKMHTFIKSYCH